MFKRPPERLHRGKQQLPEFQQFPRFFGKGVVCFVVTLVLELLFLPILTLTLLGDHEVGAGEGNRTLVSGLGSPRSTIEPHPRPEALLF